MIYTVTLNPALDRYIVVEQLLEKDTTRILSETPYAAGNHETSLAFPRYLSPLDSKSEEYG